MRQERSVCIVIHRASGAGAADPSQEVYDSEGFDLLRQALSGTFATVGVHVGPLGAAPEADAYLCFLVPWRCFLPEVDAAMARRARRSLIIDQATLICGLSEAFATLGGVDEEAHTEWLFSQRAPEEGDSDPPRTVVATRRSLAARLAHETTTIYSSQGFVLSYLPMDFPAAIARYLGMALEDEQVPPTPLLEDLTRRPGEEFLREGFFLSGRTLAPALRRRFAPHWAQHLLHENVPQASVALLRDRIFGLVAGRRPEQMPDELFPAETRDLLRRGLIDQCNGQAPLVDLVTRAAAHVTGAPELSALGVFLGEVHGCMTLLLSGAVDPAAGEN